MAPPTDLPTSCLEWLGARDKGGYGCIRKELAHRRAWVLSNGPIPAGLSVLHRCDNPPCVNPEHLFLGTQRDNLADMTAKGRRGVGALHGEAHPSSKLTTEQVLAIRTRYRAGGESWANLARSFEVSKSQIGQIVRRLQWAHVA